MRMDEEKKVFANNLRNQLSAAKMSQRELADALGLPKQTINNWANAVSMPKTVALLDKVCVILSCGREDLINPVGTVQHSQAIRIPVYGRIAAGIPLEMITDINDFEELDPKKFNPEDTYFALTIHGDSMEPKMSEGDVVIVRAQDDAESGDICIVSVNGMEATCKRIRKHPDGLELIALNPSYGPMFYTPEQCRTLPVRIRGKVVELRAKF